MGLINKYPYTDYHEVNLDYILDKVNNVQGMKLVIEGNTLKLVDGDGVTVSSVPYPANPGTTVMVDIYDLDETRHRTFFYDLVSMEVNGVKTYKSSMSLSDIQTLLTAGNNVCLRHHKYWDNLSNNIDTVRSLTGGTIYIAQNGYITFSWTMEYDNGDNDNVYFCEFLVKAGSEGTIDIIKETSIILATVEES